MKKKHSLPLSWFKTSRNKAQESGQGIKNDDTPSKLPFLYCSLSKCCNNFYRKHIKRLVIHWKNSYTKLHKTHWMLQFYVQTINPVAIKEMKEKKFYVCCTFMIRLTYAYYWQISHTTKNEWMKMFRFSVRICIKFWSFIVITILWKISYKTKQNTKSLCALSFIVIEVV